MQDQRLVAWARAIFFVALAGLLVSIAQTTVSFRAKTMLEQRVEILEAARKDQQKRNEGQDALNDLFSKAYEDWIHANKQRDHR